MRPIPTRKIALGLAAACAAGACLALAGGHVEPAAAAPSASALPPIGHVWVIELENKGFGQAFTPGSGNTYLSRTLPAQGALLTKYYGTGHFSLDNYITELSGQAPNAYTQGDCQSYIDVIPGTASPLGSDQVVGQGCVYPAAVKSIADQLTEHGKTWHGYMEDLGKDPARDNVSATDPTCGAPVLQSDPTRLLTFPPSLKSPADPTQSATATDQYAARHNPFIYFHALTDTPAGATTSPCQRNVGPLVNPTTHVDQLAKDVASVATTPTFSFITPNLCNDAHDAMCAGPNLAPNSPATGADGGLLAADYFLKRYVPEITSSPAFKKDGLLIVTLDESGDGTDTSCCNEPTGPNTPAPGQGGPGGGLIGTVLLSPFIKAGTVSAVPYNHYGFLRSMEDELGLGATTTIPGADGQGHLGYAAADLVTFHSDVFTAYAPATGTTTPTSPTTPGSAGSSSGGSLAATGMRTAVPVAAVLLVLAGSAGAVAARRGRR